MEQQASELPCVQCVFSQTYTPFCRKQGRVHKTAAGRMALACAPLSASLTGAMPIAVPCALPLHLMPPGSAYLREGSGGPPRQGLHHTRRLALHQHREYRKLAGDRVMLQHWSCPIQACLVEQLVVMVLCSVRHRSMRGRHVCKAKASGAASGGPTQPRPLPDGPCQAAVRLPGAPNLQTPLL